MSCNRRRCLSIPPYVSPWTENSAPAAKVASYCSNQIEGPGHQGGERATNDEQPMLGLGEGLEEEFNLYRTQPKEKSSPGKGTSSERLADSRMFLTG